MNNSEFTVLNDELIDDVTGGLWPIFAVGAVLGYAIGRDIF